MRKTVLILVCGILLLVQPASSQEKSQAPSSPPKHGGIIETRYDGFSYETVMRLRRMKVTCDGFKDKFKDACVSIEVTLHCPGTQLNYVRNVTLQVVFENKDWVHLHPIDQRDLSVVTDAETFRFGRMKLVTNSKSGTWDTKVETLEATVPYEAFKRIALSQSVEIQVGRSAVALREKNVAALRDLSSRVISPQSTSISGSPRD
jgi:hypothetical protein